MTLMYSKPRWNHVIMELANRAVNLVKFVCSALHLMIAIVVIYQICGVDCGTFLSSLTPKSYNTSDGRLCYMCAPGQFWVGDCIRPGEVARCQPCTKGFFQAVENVERDCQQCTKNCTQQNQEFIEACNSTTDNICQCSSGYFKLDNKGFCKNHKTCAPGEGVIKPGNKDRDTICESCLAGKYYSINESATEGCHLCTRCEVEMTPCTITSDAQCETSGPPDGSQNMGVIVGSTVGALSCSVIIIIVIAVCCCLRRHRRNSHSPEDDADGRNRENQPGISKTVLTGLSYDLISADWTFFFRGLSVDENKIVQVKKNYGEVWEQIYQLLVHAKQKRLLTKSSLRDALIRVGRNDLAEKYSEVELSDS